MKRILLLMLILINVYTYSQVIEINPVKTTLPFLELFPNARIGATGEIGAVSSSFYNDAGLIQNPALLAKNGRYAGGSFSYMPWLRNYIDEIFLIEGNAYFSINSKNSIGFALKYFSQGNIIIRNEFGDLANINRPRDLSGQISFSHIISENWSLGLGLKYIYSKIGEGELTTGYTIKPLNTFAIDIGSEYYTGFAISENSMLNFNVGGVINNFGPRITYTDDPNISKSFIPAVLRIGVLINPDFYLAEDLRLNIDLAYQADKYLVPTPPVYDNTGTTIVQGKDPDISPFRALYQSFYDAPNGFAEEMHEIMHKIGSEVRMNYLNIIYFALRYGRYMEHVTKGNRKYDTFGIGIGLAGLSVDGKLIRTNNYYLDNTWAISIGYRTNLEELFKF
ncbi:MAG: PorV/PorQ family protein [Bacteroidales bacterium]|nr:PorV/PorQ family protein [Bacteroidales bacterium]